MFIQDTLTPYKTIEYEGIQYSSCRDYSHISRHKGLRQVVHSPENVKDRFMALETVNPFKTSVEVVYHTVAHTEENRLDLIAYQYLGSPSYAWVIAYFNNIEDGFTIFEGQTLIIPKFLTSLFNNDEVLASISALTLNLGSE